MSDAGWSAVVVFKGRGSSKTRLDLDSRAALAEAFLLDTLAAVGGAEEVCALHLVTSDARAAERARRLLPELTVIADPGTLNAAVSVGLAAALEARPEAPAVALTGDLPALVPVDLDQVLRAARGSLPAVVADRAGTGTTALLVASGLSVTPAFGVGSFERHRAAGCRPVDVPDHSTLRLDVDTVEDLRAAEEAGLGPHTAHELLSAV